MTVFWNTFLDVLAVIGNLAIYLLWGFGMVWLMRFIRDF